MPAASILPVAIHNGKLYFLFGKENSLEDSAKGFSDFGGGVDAGETALQTAMREGSEELTGFLGTKEMLRKRLKHTGTYKIVYEFPEKKGDEKTNTDKPNTYTVFIFPIQYDTAFVEYFNNNHAFLWERMDKKLLSSTKLFEKIKIEWFCEDELLKRRSEYRSFYRDIVELVLEHKPKIRVFITSRRNKTHSKTISKTCSSTTKRTRNYRGGK
jgi:8-oxo-dGTP pyrophosphatase MutT (NUDIX family)